MGCGANTIELTLRVPCAYDDEDLTRRPERPGQFQTLEAWAYWWLGINKDGVIEDWDGLTQDDVRFVRARKVR